MCIAHPSNFSPQIPHLKTRYLPVGSNSKWGKDFLENMVLYNKKTPPTTVRKEEPSTYTTAVQEPPHGLKGTTDERKRKLTLVLFLPHTFTLQELMSNTLGIFMQYKEISKFFNRKSDMFGSFRKIYNCPRKSLLTNLPLIDFLFYCACM